MTAVLGVNKGDCTPAPVSVSHSSYLSSRDVYNFIIPCTTPRTDNSLDMINACMLGIDLMASVCGTAMMILER